MTVNENVIKRLHDSTQLNAVGMPDREMLDAMARDDRDHIRELVASSIQCPPDILDRLANDDVVSVARAVAQNPACSLPTLQWLSDNHQDLHVLIACCVHPASTPKDRRNALARVPESRVKDIATHPTELPDDILDYLAASEDPLARGWLAKRSDLSMKLLERLNRDSHSSVRVETLSNPHITQDMVLRLANEEDDYVKGSAACSGHLSVAKVIEMLATSSLTFKNFVADYHHDETVLSHLFYTYCDRPEPLPPDTSSCSITLAMACNNSTPTTILQRIYEIDRSEDMQWRLICNRNISGQLLCQLGFGSLFEEIRVDAIAVLEDLPPNEWECFADKGLTLDTGIILEHDNNQVVPLSELLLYADLSDAYQQLQARALQHQVNASISHQHQADNSLRANLPKLRI